MVDPLRVRTLLDRLAAEVEALRRLGARSTGELLADDDLLAAVKYRFIIAIEVCIDVGRHVIASEGLRAPLVVAENEQRARLKLLGNGRATLVQSDDGGSQRVLILRLDRSTPGSIQRVEVVVDGWRFEVEVEPEQRAALRERARRTRDDAGHSGPVEVHAIIPGVVMSIAVTAGDTVEAGQQLLVIEAMKMQNELRAPRAGTIQRIAVGERSRIEVGDLLVVLE